MSDARIHLILKYMATFDPFVEVSIIFPQTDKSLHFNSFTEMNEHHEKIEALVRNLAAHDSYDQYRFYCKECGYSTIEKHKRFTISNIGCPRCHDTMQSLKLDEKSYDTKLKVTFGSGTWVHTCRKTCITPHITTKLELPKEIIEKQIIESLQPLEKVCHELGIEVEY